MNKATNNMAPYQKDFAEFGELFGRYAREFFSPYFPEDDAGNLSADFDLHQSKNRYIVSGDLPDLTPEELKITFKNNTLFIKGVSDDEDFYQNLSYKIQFEESIDPSSIEATLNNGELRVMLEKKNGEVSDKRIIIPINKKTH